MSSGSLRLRLMLGAALAVLAAMAIAWIAMTLLFARHIERRVASELTRDAMQLLARLALDADGRPHLGDTPADPRFDTPASGLYWQVSTKVGTLRSRSLWDASLPSITLRTDAREWSTRHAAGPFGRPLFLLERRVRIERLGRPVLVQLAHGEDELRSARAEFGRELALFLAVLWGVLLLAAWLQVRLGLLPLARVGEELASLRLNPAARMTRAYPREIAPLTEAINRLADAREKDLARARHRAADLAHSLKTPLSALKALSRRARDGGASDAAEGLDRVIASAAAAVEAELARSRAAAARLGHAASETAPERVAERVVGVLERTELGARLVFDIEVAAELRLRIAEGDLTELLGALSENAARFARRYVRIAGSQDGDGVVLCVEDDGHGLDISAETALMRGGRLDEVGPNHDGLGLSIVRDLVEATGGTIALDRSPFGGLRVTLRWPDTGDARKAGA